MNEPHSGLWQQKSIALSLLKSPHKLSTLNHLKSLHVHLLHTGLHHSNFAVGNFITQCASLGLMSKYSEELPVKDEVTWYAMLSSYVNKFNDMDKARDLFEKIPCKDLGIWHTIILGFVKAGHLELAKEYFDRAPVKDLLMYNTILGCLVKNGEVDCVLRLFHEMPCRDLVSWNTVIGGLVPGALDTGKWLHSYIDRRCDKLNDLIGTALVDMYCKCGDLESAADVFNKMSERDVVAWSAMIMGSSMNRQSETTLNFFYRMKDESGRPNDATILGVLCACVHAGLVDEGRKCFYGMTEEFGLTPKLEHYGCMVDLLGRAGFLDEAYNLIQSMPYEPHTGAWGALLGACKIHGNVELAEKAIEHLIQLDLEDGGYLAIMSNIYANAGRWEDVSRVRKLMKEIGIGKSRGISSIEVNGVIHEFGDQENKHPQAREIYDMIDEIYRRLKSAGHVASTREVFFDVEEEEKALLFHSEKMAVAFGLIVTDKNTVIL
ncbi:hypothetical protein RND71_035875 [Anisodus tanguticus]|uniref:Uncharacterized protein n=1 Tax=Anisodus tanguticus TaxID=243964 RepID=A0AAE1V1X1_9SOLA|nr:hypothetical protein RND71_035875 [Anisodus tanguticus]